MRLEGEKASLTHRLKHQVNVPVVLRPDHVQEADDVRMVPKLLRREPGAVCFVGDADLGFPPTLLGEPAPGGAARWPGLLTWSSMISRNVLWSETEI